jgi:hypothetical protein
MNLWEETIYCLELNGKTWDDVEAIGCGAFQIIKENFEIVAKVTEYDGDYGSQRIAQNLIILGDDWWICQGECDGAEWWEFNIKPDEIMDKPMRFVKYLDANKANLTGWKTLGEINNIPKEDKAC